LIGQKPPLRAKDVWAIRIYLQNAHAVRYLALFNLAIDSKLRGCDLVSLRVRDVTHGNQLLPQALIVQLTEPTRLAVGAWLEKAALRPEQYLFTSRLSASPHLSTRQYARMIHRWAGAAGLDPTVYGTHSMRGTKATLIYKRTKNLRAVQLLLGHSKVESTIRYLGIEVDDALEISEQTEI
jgi:integrase